MTSIPNLISSKGGLLLALVLVPSVALGSQWVHPAGTADGANRSDGTGGITGGEDRHPGTAWQVSLPALGFPVALISDTDGDGEPELIRPHRQRIAAFGLPDIELAWTSVAAGVTDVWGVADTDGDGVDDELIAVGAEMGGGLLVVDLASGALLYSNLDLVGLSGVHPEEVAVHDVDGDGADEILFSAFVLGARELYLVDLSQDGVPRVVTSELLGEGIATNRMAIGDFDGDGVDGEIVLFEGYDLDMKQLCDVGDPNASCDSIDQTVCLCDVQLAAGAWQHRAWPVPPRTLDADDDGDAELLSIHNGNYSASGVGVVDPTSFFSGDATPALGGWLYDYTHLQPGGPQPLAAAGRPVDLDGDGGLDIVVTVFDAGSGELDLAGVPVDVGLDNPGGFTLGVYAAVDGALLASLDDVYAHGRADVDGDGVPEIVVETTVGGDFSGGHVEGWELECAATCELTLSWSSEEHRLTRFPATFDGVGFPPRKVRKVDSDGDGVPALLVWSGDDLTAVEADGVGGLVVLGSADTTADTEFSGFEGMGNLVLLNDFGVVSILDGNLGLVAAVDEVSSEQAGRWLAAFMGPEDERATPILDGHVFHSVAAPSSLADADAQLLPNVALAQDVDSDGLMDLFSWTYDGATGAVQVARNEYDGADGFPLVWDWTAEAEVDLAGAEPQTQWPFNAFDADGDGVDDLTFALEGGGGHALVTLDGATGDVDWIGLFSNRDAEYSPLLGLDVIGPGGYGDSDGVLDVVRPSRRYTTAWAIGADDPGADVVNSGDVSNYLFADLDGDGVPELVGGKLARITGPTIEAHELLPEIALKWGPVAVDIPPDVEQAMTLASIDAGPEPDIVYASASGGIGALAGPTGVGIDGFPYYLSRGEGGTEQSSESEPITAIAAVDIDGDGFDEVLAGSSTGYLYAVDVAQAEGAPSLFWTIEIGAAIRNIALADTDGDGEVEILLSTVDGKARVIDGLGAWLLITSHGDGDCVTADVIEVCGDSEAIDTVNVFVQGIPAAEGVPVDPTDGTFCVDVAVPLVAGLIEVAVEGLSGDVPAALAGVLLGSDIDGDGDGVTVCGGDCDDNNPARAPGLAEVCDGLDNDCDPDTDENADGDGDGSGACEDCDDTDPDAAPGLAEVCADGADNDCDGLTDEGCEEPTPGDDTDPDGGCEDCDGCSSGGRGTGARLGWVLLALLGICRRTRSWRDARA